MEFQGKERFVLSSGITIGLASYCYWNVHWWGRKVYLVSRVGDRYTCALLGLCPWACREQVIITSMEPGMCVQNFRCLVPWHSRNSHKEDSVSGGNDNPNGLIVFLICGHWAYPAGSTLLPVLPSSQVSLFEESLVLCGVLKISTLGFYRVPPLISKGFSYSTSLCSFLHSFPCLRVRVWMWT